MQVLLIFNININIAVEFRKLVSTEDRWRKSYRWTRQWELYLAVVGLLVRNSFVLPCMFFFIISVADRVIRNVCHTAGISSATGAGAWFQILSPFFFINNDYISYSYRLLLLLSGGTAWNITAFGTDWTMAWPTKDLGDGFPAVAADFSLLQSVQNGSWEPPTFLINRCGGPFPRRQAPGLSSSPVISIRRRVPECMELHLCSTIRYHGTVLN